MLSKTSLPLHYTEQPCSKSWKKNGYLRQPLTCRTLVAPANHPSYYFVHILYRIAQLNRSLAIYNAKAT